MKKNFTPSILALVLSSSILMFSCKNDSENISFISKPSAIGFSEIRATALNDITIKKAFKAEDGIDFKTDKGTKIKFFANCLQDKDGNTVSGDVSLSFTELQDRGNMVLTNKPLMGNDGSGNYLPLVTGGQYHITVSKGSEELSPGCPFQIVMPASLTGGLDGAMKLWRGNIGEDGELFWDVLPRENVVDKEGGLNINKETATYDIWGSEFGWTNVDRFYNDSRPKTQIKVTVPSAYNPTNAAVYLSYENERNLLARLDTYDVEEHYFSEHYGFVPVGLNVHVIFTSESNGSVVYAIKKVAITANGVINFNENELNVTNKNNLVNLINSLN